MDRINKTKFSSTLNALGNFVLNKKAYNLNDVRKFKSDKDGKEHLYYFCSPTFTDLSEPRSGFRELEYLGTGFITMAGEEPIKDKEKCHFWGVKNPGVQFN